jgi:hypothetical protein
MNLKMALPFYPVNEERIPVIGKWFVYSVHGPDQLCGSLNLHLPVCLHGTMFPSVDALSVWVSAVCHVPAGVDVITFVKAVLFLSHAACLAGGFQVLPSMPSIGPMIGMSLPSFCVSSVGLMVVMSAPSFDVPSIGPKIVMSARSPCVPSVRPMVVMSAPSLCKHNKISLWDVAWPIWRFLTLSMVFSGLMSNEEVSQDMYCFCQLSRAMHSIPVLFIVIYFMTRACCSVVSVVCWGTMLEAGRLQG